MELVLILVAVLCLLILVVGVAAIVTGLVLLLVVFRRRQAPPVRRSRVEWTGGSQTTPTPVARSRTPTPPRRVIDDSLIGFFDDGLDVDNSGTEPIASLQEVLDRIATEEEDATEVLGDMPLEDETDEATGTTEVIQEVTEPYGVDYVLEEPTGPGRLVAKPE